MKSLMSIAATLAVFMASAAPSIAQAPPLRILPLGDSLTFGCCSGSSEIGGYRVQLYSRLLSAGFNPDYVGGRNGPAGSPLPDRDHEGTSGFRIDQITDRVGEIDALIEDPDVVLVLAGANDFSQNYLLSGVRQRFEKMLLDLSSRYPQAEIIVGNLLLRTDSLALNQAQVQFNSQLTTLVAELALAGHRVSIENVRTSVASIDLNDGVHPTQTGYNKLGDAWFAAINDRFTSFGTRDPLYAVKVEAPTSLTELKLHFNKPVEDAAAQTGNFSISGGINVLGASLDPVTKKVVTLTTSTQNPGELHTLTMNNIRDRSPESAPLPNGTTIRFTTRVLRNGSFENGFVNWTKTGNVEAKVGASIDGSGYLAFNGANLPSNGVLSQSFPTIPGQNYGIRFSLGTVSFVTTTQTMETVVSGNSERLRVSDSVLGIGGGRTNWFGFTHQFVADSMTSTVTFQDISATSNALDLLLDAVSIVGIETETLALRSTPEGALISVSPFDDSGNGQGVAPLDRIYPNGSQVSVTAAPTNGALNFVKWQRDGTDLSTSETVTVTANSSFELNAVYAVGAPLIASQPANVSASEGTTAMFSVAATGASPIAYQWRKDGVNVPGANSSSLVISDVTFANGGFYDVVVSNSVATKTSKSAFLNVAPVSVFANGGFEAGVLPWTTTGNVEVVSPGPGAIQGQAYARFNAGQTTPNGLLVQAISTIPGQNYSLAFKMGTVSFNKIAQTLRVGAQGSQSLLSQNVTLVGKGGGITDWVEVSLAFTADTRTTVISFEDISPGTINIDLLLDHVRVIERPAVESISNGSFEFGLGGWTATGAILIGNQAPYIATDGTNLVSFNGNNQAPNGVLSQLVRTIPGRTYVLEFDAGAIAFQSVAQSIGLRVEGSQLLVEEALVFNPPANGQARWTSQRFSFVADSQFTNVVFSDLSTSTAFADLLLDNVRLNREGGDLLLNGSFESGFESWEAAGNLGIQFPSANARDGSSLVTFNDAQRTPNGTLKQTFNTIQGLTYRVEFELGVIGNTAAGQRMDFRVTNGQVLAGDQISIFGQAGGAARFESKSYEFIATGPTATLEFKDISPTTNNIDMLLDDVRITQLLARDSLVNGSFEAGFTAWSAAGSILIVTDFPGYPAPDGGTLLIFNASGNPANGVLEQKFFTTPGEEYTVSMELGTFSAIAGQQSMQVIIEGDGVISSQVATVDGAGGNSLSFQPVSYSFVANSTISTLTLRDVSASTTGLDLALDNVRVRRTSSIVGTPFINGSFEEVFAGWDRAGNIFHVPSSPAATDGQAVIAFNAGQQAPNGILTQSFATVPGLRYSLTMDVGILANNFNEQRLGVRATGNSLLLEETVSRFGNNRGNIVFTPASFTFIADSPITQLQLRDQSPTTINLDLYLDNVRVLPEIEYALTVNSAPVTGLNIDVTSTDVPGDGGGSTPLNYNYPAGSTVQLTAPEISGDLVFLRWDDGDQAFSSSREISITMDGSRSLTAVYAQGAPIITAQPGDFVGTIGRTAVFSVAATGNTPLGYQWRFGGVPIQGATNPTLTLFPLAAGSAGSYDVVVTNAVGNRVSRAASLTIGTLGAVTDGSFEAGGSAWTSTGNVVVVPNVTGAPNGSSVVVFNGGQQAPNGSISQTLATVPGQAYRVTFAYGVFATNTRFQRMLVTAQGNQLLLSEGFAINRVSGPNMQWRNGEVQFVADSSNTVLTFTDISTDTQDVDLLLDNVVVTPILPLGKLLNGSFENYYDAWNPTGSQALASNAPYVATDGAILLVFNGGGTPNNGTISQQFATVPGERYTLTFDLGIHSTAVRQQSMRTTVVADQTLLDQTVTIQGAGANQSQWLEQLFTFVASGSTATITFSDVSATGANADLLLDNIRLAPITSTPQSGILNGGFETGLDGWSLIGNAKRISASFNAHQGSSFIELNGAQLPANAVLSQTFETIPGRRYSLTLQGGTVGSNSQPMRLETMVQGGSTLLNNTASIPTAPGGAFRWTGYAYEFTADSAQTTLSFIDRSVSTLNADLLLDTIRVELLPPFEELLNGGFEADLEQWANVGNIAITGGLPYVPNQGAKLLVFNASGTTPNGVITQQVSTVPGRSYTLQLSAGTLDYGNGTQVLGVTVDGSGTLIAEDITIQGTGTGMSPWSVISRNFVANSSITSITFSDMSTETATNDLLLDAISLQPTPVD